MSERTDNILAQLSLDEKVAAVAGQDVWRIPVSERLGIPPWKVTDGPNGARGGDFGGGVAAAVFPSPTCLGASWDPDLVERLGVALGQEARSKAAVVLLAPTINIQRHPVGGRHFEAYSEDPYLTGRIAVGYVNGVQSQRVATAIKHYVANDQEENRNDTDTIVSERTLREIYLPPFEAAVKEANTLSMMGAYNKVNGTFACEHRRLLTDILKDEWGFNGFVVTDWLAIKSTVEAANAGLDLDMPGPSNFWGEKLKEAIENGEVEESVLDDKVRRILEMLEWSGHLDDPMPDVEVAEDRPEHRTLIREAAAAGSVLLKNNGVLPIDASKVGRVAVIGPNADTVSAQGGGSAGVTPHYIIQPLDALRDRIDDVVHERGCSILRYGEPLSARHLDGEATLEMYEPGLGGEPFETKSISTTRWIRIGDAPTAPSGKLAGTRMRCRFIPEETGTYQVGGSIFGKGRILVDGEPLLDLELTEFGMSALFGEIDRAPIDLTAGQAVEIVLENAEPVDLGLPINAARISVMPPVLADGIDRAVEAAASSEAAIVVIGNNDQWETEGEDRKSLDLPGDQNELVRRVAAANKNTIVVLNVGAPVEMPWIDDVSAVVLAWYPGQEAGNAIADVLLGDVDPGGRLPTTWPKKMSDSPVLATGDPLQYPGVDLVVRYDEGVFVGYRAYDRDGIEPLWPFGHGLSYTSFELGDVSVSGSGTSRTVTVPVTNTGDRTGTVVVQCYVGDVEASVDRPEKELKAFTKLSLEPGDSATAEMTLDDRSFAFWGDDGWTVEPGDFVISVGTSAAVITSSTSITV